MVEGAGLNVVDGPFRGRRRQPISAGGRKRIIRSREACGGTRAGSPEQNYVGVSTVVITLAGSIADLRTVAKPHFGQNRADVVAYGAFAHVGRGGNLLVVEARAMSSATSNSRSVRLAKAVGRRSVPASTPVPSKSISSIALPSSTRLPLMTCANAGGMAATSVLIR